MRISVASHSFEIARPEDLHPKDLEAAVQKETTTPLTGTQVKQAAEALYNKIVGTDAYKSGKDVTLPSGEVRTVLDGVAKPSSNVNALKPETATTVQGHASKMPAMGGLDANAFAPLAPPQLAHKQKYDNSCGAASLLTVAGELGVKTLPDLGRPLWNGRALATDNGPDGSKCEDAIYQVTCGNPRVKDDLTKEGYSYPAQIVACARSLGLDAEIYLEDTIHKKVLTTFHKKNVDECRNSGISLKEGAPPKLGPDERAMKVMGVLKGAAGLHWVVNRPDGSFMDPGEGKNFRDFTGMNNSWLKSYGDTGITIVFKKAQPKPLEGRAQDALLRDLKGLNDTVLTLPFQDPNLGLAQARLHTSLRYQLDYEKAQLKDAGGDATKLGALLPKFVEQRREVLGSKAVQDMLKEVRSGAKRDDVQPPIDDSDLLAILEAGLKDFGRGLRP